MTALERSRTFATVRSQCTKIPHHTRRFPSFSELPSPHKDLPNRPRTVSQTAPGRLRVPARPAQRPVPAERGRLQIGGKRGNARYAGSQEARLLELSQRRMRSPWASAAAERRKARGLAIRAAAALAHGSMATSDCAARPMEGCAFAALRLPSGEARPWRWYTSLGRKQPPPSPSRERLCAPPSRSGEGESGHAKHGGGGAGAARPGP